MRWPLSHPRASACICVDPSFLACLLRRAPHSAREGARSLRPPARYCSGTCRLWRRAPPSPTQRNETTARRKRPPSRTIRYSLLHSETRRHRDSAPSPPPLTPRAAVSCTAKRDARETLLRDRRPSRRAPPSHVQRNETPARRPRPLPALALRWSLTMPHPQRRRCNLPMHQGPPIPRRRPGFRLTPPARPAARPAAATRRRARNARRSSRCRTARSAPAPPPCGSSRAARPPPRVPSAATTAVTRRWRSCSFVPGGSSPRSTRLPNGTRGVSRRDIVVPTPSSGAGLVWRMRPIAASA